MSANLTGRSAGEASSSEAPTAPGFGAAAGAALGSKRLTGIIVLGIWTLPALLSASQRYIVLRGMPEYRVTWVEAFWRQAPGWYLWAFFTLLILWLGRRFPVERAHWRRSLVVHLPAAVVMALGHASLLALIGRIDKPEAVAEYTFLGHSLRQLSTVLHIDLLLYAAILGVGYAIAYYHKYQEREILTAQLQGQLAQAQLQTLRMQLNPHFLYNALNATASLVRKQENAAAVQMLAGLGDLLRHSLEEPSSHEVLLEKELEFLRRYLEIEQVRFSDRLQVELDIDPEAAHACVPSLLLQPLVENAVKHGIGKSARAGRIQVRARRSVDVLEVVVRDDGPGLGDRDPAGTGVGLENTRVRLEKLYAEKGSLSLTNNDDAGVSATVRIPYRLPATPWRAGS